ncbi:MAG: polysaccharide pyruvyl transferase family protein [Actinomycetales bacterium]|jgi:polysaccharide pyruvyl transferase WcaK-like protein|nr:polysaccharide pyruvyl transferase family protein [Actinomycetales bacterium]
MKILLVNQHTSNFGDDAAGLAFVEMALSSGRVDSIDVIYNGGEGGIPTADERVRRPEGVELKQIGVFTLAVYFASMGLLVAGCGRRALNGFRDLVRSADLVFVAPCGANIGIYRSWHFLVRLLIVVREGGRPIFHLNTLGRSGDWLFDRIALSVLRRSTLYVRDVASQAFLREVGLDAPTGPDTAFALPARHGGVREDVLSFVPSELDSWHPEFRENGANSLILGTLVDEVARFAVTEGLRIEILPHLRSAGEVAFNRAVQAALIAAGAPAGAVIIRGDITELSAYDSAIASSRLVIGGRYHSIVLAAKNHRPFVALSYENKMQEVCRYLGMERLRVDLHHPATAGRELRSSLETALREECSISETLRNVVLFRLRSEAARPLSDFGLTPRMAF